MVVILRGFGRSSTSSHSGSRMTRYTALLILDFTEPCSIIEDGAECEVCEFDKPGWSVSFLASQLRLWVLR